MTIHRIYQDTELQQGQAITLESNAANHVAKVLRLRVNEPIILFNGDGHEYHGQITQIEKRHVEIAINFCKQGDVESPLKLHLGQSIARGERMDAVIQKSIELGVSEITPLFTEFCTVKLNAERIEKRLQHWQAIIISACEQCGRNQIPQLHPPEKLATWLGIVNSDLKVIFDPSGEQQLPSQSPTSATLLIGPEGGFSQKEVTLALEHGFIGKQLGPRLLRTDTATVAALTMLQSKYGDV